MANQKHSHRTKDEESCMSRLEESSANHMMLVRCAKVCQDCEAARIKTDREHRTCLEASFAQILSTSVSSSGNPRQ